MTPNETTSKTLRHSTVATTVQPLRPPAPPRRPRRRRRHRHSPGTRRPQTRHRRSWRSIRTAGGLNLSSAPRPLWILSAAVPLARGTVAVAPQRSPGVITSPSRVTRTQSAGLPLLANPLVTPSGRQDLNLRPPDPQVEAEPHAPVLSPRSRWRTISRVKESTLLGLCVPRCLGSGIVTERRICTVYARSHTQHRTNLSTAHAAGTQLPHRLRQACQVGQVIIHDRGGYFADSFDAISQSIVCVPTTNRSYR